MAVAVVMDFEGGTLAQYDEVIERMGLSDDSPAPEGALFHYAHATDAGIRVSDVWETREQFEAFSNDQIGPITRAVGVPGPPRVTLIDVHNYMTGATTAATAG